MNKILLLITIFIVISISVLGKTKPGEDPCDWVCYWIQEGDKSGAMDYITTRFNKSNPWVNCRDYYKRTPLITAARHRQVKLVKWILKSGANPNIKYKGEPIVCNIISISKCPNLSYSMKYKYKKIIILLIKHGAKSPCTKGFK